jgi:hypothetical protein
VNVNNTVFKIHYIQLIIIYRLLYFFTEADEDTIFETDIRVTFRVLDSDFVSYLTTENVKYTTKVWQCRHRIRTVTGTFVFLTIVTSK